MALTVEKPSNAQLTNPPHIASSSPCHVFGAALLNIWREVTAHHFVVDSTRQENAQNNINFTDFKHRIVGCCYSSTILTSTVYLDTQWLFFNGFVFLHIYVISIFVLELFFNSTYM